MEGNLAGDGLEWVDERAEAVYASAASIWEIEIKNALGRLEVPGDFIGLVERSRFEPLPVGFDHAVEAGRLPLHHRDPFDRMLVAQARVEGLTLATADEQLQRYDVQTLGVVRG